MGRILVAGLSVAALWAGSAQGAPAKLYSAKEGAESVSVQVIQDAGGPRLVITRSGANGCAVKVEGPAKSVGATLKLAADDQGRPCDVELISKGAYAELLENSCPLHGDACRLDDLPILTPR